ncbi:uncharacterized protein [Macrobrachium rosenbergii]|uniref:uncharacterized protein isoform X2 n=1 Tax=Macrobrachium rosenbergii TaxID=79674 RepID=UPI0034D4697F
MANSLPNDPPPPYTATPPPLGFQSPDPPPTVRVEVQEEGGYLVGQQQYPPAYPYAHGRCPSERIFLLRDLHGHPILPYWHPMLRPYDGKEVL